MGFGLIAGALSGAGNSIANSASDFQKFNDVQATKNREAEIEQAMLKHRADAHVEMSNRIADYNNGIANAPANRAREIMASVGGQVPVDAEQIGKSSANAIGLPDGVSGNVSKLREEFARKAADPTFTDAQRRNASDVLDQINAQAAAQQGGSMRDMTQHERLAAAYEAAMGKGDLQAAALLKAAIPEKWTAIPDGASLRNNMTGEIITPGMSKAERQERHDDRADERTDKRIEAAAKAAELRDKNARERAMPPSDTSQDEKDLWIRKYIADGGAVPRSAPAYVRNSIGTWASQKGITPDDLSKGTAQAKFDMSAAVTSGHRAGSMAGVEAAMPALVDNAITMSAKISRGNFVPLNKLMLMGEDTISDPDMAAFRVAHQALASEYQQVIGRGGANVFALKEAMHVLEAAKSQEAYIAAANQVSKEVKINVDAMNTVRSNVGGAHVTPPAGAVGAGHAKPSAAPGVIDFGSLK